MRWIKQFLTSSRLALAVLSFLAVYSAIAVLFSWPQAFSSIPFLAASLLLFVNTLACTWARTPQIWALWRGKLPATSLRLPARPGHDFRRFLLNHGFKAEREYYFRFRFAVWGGWILHAGILVLMLGVLVHQGFHDGGAFEAAEGETVKLSDPGVVFAREAGPFASKVPPDLELTLIQFDPFLHQEGYAPDRASRMLAAANGTRSRVFLDRAEGTLVAGIRLYQAIPTGLSLNLLIAQMGARSLHLRTDGDRSASSEVFDPAGIKARFFVQSERPLNDPMGTGPLKIRMFREGKAVDILPGAAFEYGRGHARLLSVGRWGGFTYSRAPGINAVFSGFFLILCGSFLLVFPVGLAYAVESDRETAGWIYAKRDARLLAEDWENMNSEQGNDSQVATEVATTSPGKRI